MLPCYGVLLSQSAKVLHVAIGLYVHEKSRRCMCCHTNQARSLGGMGAGDTGIGSDREGNVRSNLYLKAPMLIQRPLVVFVIRQYVLVDCMAHACRRKRGVRSRLMML